MSVVVLLVTVTLSVRPLVVVFPPLLPRTSATISKINTAPPTTQTHGSVYQVCVSEVAVVVVVVAVTVLSCAQATAFATENKHSINAFLKNPGLIRCFNFFCFWVKKYLHKKFPAQD